MNTGVSLPPQSSCGCLPLTKPDWSLKIKKLSDKVHIVWLFQSQSSLEEREEQICRGTEKTSRQQCGSI